MGRSVFYQESYEHSLIGGTLSSLPTDNMHYFYERVEKAFASIHRISESTDSRKPNFRYSPFYLDPV
jgi:histone acetyltransferase (RNA polymerase elongator complex component)